MSIIVLLQVTTVGKFNEAKPSTKMTFAIVVMCLITTLAASVTLSLYILGITKFPWPSIIGKFQNIQKNLNVSKIILKRTT